MLYLLLASLIFARIMVTQLASMDSLLYGTRPLSLEMAILTGILDLAPITFPVTLANFTVTTMPLYPLFWHMRLLDYRSVLKPVPPTPLIK